MLRLVVLVEAMAYGVQFRKKLLSVKETEGLTNEDVAKRFGVNKGSVLRWKHDPDSHGNSHFDFSSSSRRH